MVVVITVITTTIHMYNLKASLDIVSHFFI